jgi:hypothetical protein
MKQQTFPLRCAEREQSVIDFGGQSFGRSHGILVPDELGVGFGFTFRTAMKGSILSNAEVQGDFHKPSGNFIFGNFRPLAREQRERTPGNIGARSGSDNQRRAIPVRSAP